MAGVEQGEWQPEPAISHGWPFTLQLGTVGLGEHLKQSTCNWQIVVRLFAAAGLHAAAHLAAATSLPGPQRSAQQQQHSSPARLTHTISMYIVSG